LLSNQNLFFSVPSSVLNMRGSINQDYLSIFQSFRLKYFVKLFAFCFLLFLYDIDRRRQMLFGTDDLIYCRLFFLFLFIFVHTSALLCLSVCLSDCILFHYSFSRFFIWLHLHAFFAVFKSVVPVKVEFVAQRKQKSNLFSFVVLFR
jgi:hypothetical protein